MTAPLSAGAVHVSATDASPAVATTSTATSGSTSTAISRRSSRRSCGCMRRNESFGRLAAQPCGLRRQSKPLNEANQDARTM